LPRLSLLTATPPTALYPLSLHDALPISSTWRPPKKNTASPGAALACAFGAPGETAPGSIPSMHTSDGIPHGANHLPRALQTRRRSEEHTSELQSRSDLVCRLLLEKKKKQ